MDHGFGAQPVAPPPLVAELPPHWLSAAFDVSSMWPIVEYFNLTSDWLTGRFNQSLPGLAGAQMLAAAFISPPR